MDPLAAPEQCANLRYQPNDPCVARLNHSDSGQQLSFSMMKDEYDLLISSICFHVAPARDFREHVC